MNRLFFLLPLLLCSACAADESNDGLFRSDGWLLTAITDDGAENRPKGKLRLTVSRNRVSAHGGVNGLNGKVKIGRSGTFQIKDASVTEIGGSQDLMKEEERYFGALWKVTSYETNGDSLMLSNGTKNLQLLFEPNIPPAPAPLIGTTWVYSGFEETDGVGVSLTYALDESVPNLTFGEDGKATGSGGVNRFFGTFEADSGKGSIKIGGLGSTRKGGPPKAMKQESELLQRLPTATAFSINGNQLRLSLKGGKTALIFDATE